MRLLFTACVDEGGGSKIVREDEFCCGEPDNHTWEGFSAAQRRGVAELRNERAELLGHIEHIQDQRKTDW